MAWYEKAVDSFTRANENPLANGVWSTALGSGCKIVANKVGAALSNSAHHGSLHSIALGNIQYAQVDISSNGSYDYVLVRANTTGGLNGYGLQNNATTNATTYYITKFTTGTQSLLATLSSKQSILTYPRIRLTASGSTLNADYWNGSSWVNFGTVENSSFTSGKTGVGSYMGAGGSYYMFNWAAGDDQAPGGIIVPVMLSQYSRRW